MKEGCVKGEDEGVCEGEREGGPEGECAGVSRSEGENRVRVRVRQGTKTWLM